jgi:hypothetical protein
MIKLLHEVQQRSLDVLKDETITNKMAGLTSVANEYVVRYRTEKTGISSTSEKLDERGERKVNAFYNEIVELQRELLRDVQNKN